MKVSRRGYIAGTGGALLAASSLSASMEARADEAKADTLYGHGMVWNRELAGVAGELRLAFDLRVNLETGKGFGSAGDPVHPEWGLHFAIEELTSEKVLSETRYAMRGVVTSAVNPDNVGLPVSIVAETQGDTTAIAIKVGELVFGGAGLVVIAIIAILIGLLLPAVQKV